MKTPDALHLSILVAAEAIEVLAVAIILAGVVGGTLRFLLQWREYQSYTRYKEILGKALLLGLNVLVAGDIILTVALEPTISNIAGLGLLVFVRTFVSWSLYVELEGYFPWQYHTRTSTGKGISESLRKQIDFDEAGQEARPRS